MPKKWEAQGFVVGDVDEPFKLDEDLSNHLKNELYGRGIKDIPQEFYTDLSGSIGFYLNSLNMREECKPAQIRKNLDSALTLSLRLSEQIDRLDWNSRDLIDEALDGGHESFKNYLHTLTSTLKIAREAADAYPKRGSLPNRSKVFFAYSVGAAIEKYLNKRATTTKDGIFESVLSTILSNIENKDNPSVHDLARAAIKDIYPYLGTNTVGGHKKKDE